MTSLAPTHRGKGNLTRRIAFGRAMPSLSRVLAWLAAGLLTAFGPAVALAAEAAAEHDQHVERGLIDPRPAEMLWTIVVFLIFLGVLAFVVWPRILTALKAREDKQREDLQRAEAANVQAQQTLEQYRKQLGEAQREAQEKIDQARSEAESLRQDRLKDLEQELAELRRRAAAEIDTAKTNALAEIYAHTAELATQVAGRILQREIRPEDQRELIDRSLAELGRRNN